MNDYETGMAGMRDALKTHDALLNAFSRKLYAEQFKDYYMSLIPVCGCCGKGYDAGEHGAGAGDICFPDA